MKHLWWLLLWLFLTGCATRPAALLEPIPCPDAPPVPSLVLKLDAETDTLTLWPYGDFATYLISLQSAHAKCRAAAGPALPK